MTERQYVLQHILHLSNKLSNRAVSEEERKTTYRALQFYLNELKKFHEDRPNIP